MHVLKLLFILTANAWANPLSYQIFKRPLKKSTMILWFKTIFQMTDTWSLFATIKFEKVQKSQDLFNLLLTFEYNF